MMKKCIGALTGVVLLCSSSAKSIDDLESVRVSNDPKDTIHKGFSIDFKPILKESSIIGKWVFSEAWQGHMGLALEVRKDHTFMYWFESDLKCDVEYPIRGKWSIVDGVLRLSAGESLLYSDHWVLAKSNGVEGLMNPDNITIIMIHKTLPESRFIKKLKSEPNQWPFYNYVDH